MAAFKKINLVVGFCSLLMIVFQQTAIAQTYNNPIIHEDYSDPDVIRVGNQFYMIASSFTSVPGLPILASDDLVHWHLIAYALKNNLPIDYYKKVQHGAGVWAPSIRFHNGEFYIYYPDPDFGIYLTKAKTILGPWTTPQLVLAGKGLIDPCPLWDDNGKVFLVHAYAGSRAGIKSLLAMKEMNAAGTQVMHEGKLIYDGHGIDNTVEGPKLYKRNGWYYVFAPAGGVTTGWQIVLRSRNIYGPYERRKVLEQGVSSTNGPHQGAWVQTKTGEDWFIHFQDKGAYGRITHLQPMQWKNDWPIIGEDKDGDGIGEAVATFRAPTILNAQKLKHPNDALKAHLQSNSDKLFDFQWNANPESNWRLPYLNTFRHYAVVKSDSSSNLWNFPAMYLRKIPAEKCILTTEINFNSVQVGERAGFIVFGKSYAAVELKRMEHGVSLQYIQCDKADKGNAEQVVNLLSQAPSTIFIRMQLDSNAMASFAYSTDGIHYTSVDKFFKAVQGVWVGAKIGFYCASEHTTNDAGFLEIKSFNILK